ncbi:MAG TPA: DUF3995 domain-containing protein [Ilumatobacter sp.]|jgi:hypothetical protein|nr:DUF3995 domain-containing protein [Ilumatobacter sp.]
MRTGIRRSTSITTATVLAGIGALHVAWGLGSSFPFRDRAALADTVVGNDAVPGRGASLAVAGLLGVAAGLVADVLPVAPRIRRVGVLGVACVLATRAAFGFAGSTERLVAGSNSPRFVTADRRVFAPLCAALAAGAAVSASG